MSASINRSIFGAALTVGLLTTVTKFASTAKELFVAGSFGTSDVLDAYLIAFLLPSFAASVVAGSLNAALIPIFIKIRNQEGHNAAQRLLSAVMFWMLALLGTVVLILFFLSDVVLSLVASGFSPDKLALTRWLFYLLLPVLVLSGFSNIWSAILNSSQTFALPALVPVITPVITIGTILGLGKLCGIYSVAVATLSGAVLEMGFLGWKLKRHGYSLWPDRQPGDATVKEVLGQYLPMVAGALLMSSTTVVDQSMATMLGGGSVATLNYANRIVSLIVAIGSISIGTAVLPHFSKMVAEEDWTGIWHTLKTYSRLILLTATPATVLLFFLSEPIVRLLFERSNFTSEDTVVVSRTAALFTLQIPFYLVGILGVRLLNALNKGRVIMIICAINLIVNIAANFLLMREIGIAGIALSTSLVYLLSFVLIFICVIKELRHRVLSPVTS